MDNKTYDQQLYLYPHSNVLQNKLDIRNANVLAEAERSLVRQRIREGVPEGDFDLTHLRAIHHHLFQDVYAWAGQTRKTDIHKGGQWFHPQSLIERGMQDVHKRIIKNNYLKELDHNQFAVEAGIIIGDVNLIHPFREGNGRSQLYYLKQLAQKAGHKIDLNRLDQKEWISASIKANHAEYSHMSTCIERSIVRHRHGIPEKPLKDLPKKECALEKLQKMSQPRDKAQQPSKSKKPAKAPVRSR